jgi:outer membrane protein assembly factor BamA
MKNIAIALLIMLVCFATSAAQDVMKVGNVYIVGNTITRDDIIREAVRLSPGQYLRAAEVRDSESRLSAVGLFETSGSSRPTVTVVIDDDSVFKDVIVTVKEKTASIWRTTWTLTLWDGPALHLSWEERNFDPLRWPACWEDVVEGRAFRGANQKVTLDATFTARQCVGVAEFACSAFWGLR